MPAPPLSAVAHPPDGPSVDEWTVDAILSLLAGSRAGLDHARTSELTRICGGLSGLSRLDTFELSALFASLGVRAPASAATAIAAAFELGRRVVEDEARIPSVVRNATDVAAWAIPRLGPLPHEELWMLAVDGRNRVRAARRVAMGGLHGISVRAADPLRYALRADASSFVLVHNHPSGDPTPSTEDIDFTGAVAAAASAVGCPLLDHVVVSRDAFATVSFPEPGVAG